MDASQFALWLQGFAELNATPPTAEQWQSIREHLQLVFTKVTPEVKSAEVKKPVIGLGYEQKRDFGNEPKGQPYDPWPPTPTKPCYWLDRPTTGKPDTIIC